MKKIKKIFKLIAICLVILIIMAIWYPGSFTFKKSTIGNYNDCLKRGLNNNYSALIKDIAMLGAHDAFSSEISLSSKVDVAEEGLVKNNFLRPLLKGMIVRQSRAQKASSEGLLSRGVRYFDVRLSHINGKWYTKHSLISEELSFYLIPILKFLNENPGEFIIFDIQHCYYGDLSYNDLIDDLKKITYQNQNIFDYLNYLPTLIPMGLLSYGLVTSFGTKGGVVILVKNETTIYSYDYEKSIRSVWHNKITTKEMFMDIQAEYEYLEKNQVEVVNKLVVNQAQKTAQINEQIINTIFGWSLLDLANNFNEKLINHHDFEKWLTVMPIVMVDYADSSKGNFNQKINEKIISYNQNI